MGVELTIQHDHSHLSTGRRSPRVLQGGWTGGSITCRRRGSTITRPTAVRGENDMSGVSARRALEKADLM